MRNLDLEKTGGTVNLTELTNGIAACNSPNTIFRCRIVVDDTKIGGNAVTVGKLQIILTDPTVVPVPPATAPVYTVELEVSDMDEMLQQIVRTYDAEVDAQKYSNPA